MIAGLPYTDRPVAVLGLARSGRAAAQSLVASGARLLAWDDAPESREAFAGTGLPLTDLAPLDAKDWAALVMSPGIPLGHPIAAKARDHGVPVIGDIELLWQARTGAKLLGITGTNGKSTTTALTGHILAAAGRTVAVGGNLGTPVLSLADIGADGAYVIEMSSFQLDLVTATRFSAAALLNITPDHLDRHGDMPGYAAAKRRIFRNQTAEDTAIVSVDDDWGRQIADDLAEGPMRLVRISIETALDGGVYVTSAGDLVDDGEGRAEKIAHLPDFPTLPGRHNWQNAATAYALCRAAGLETAAITAGFASFPGLVHRQEWVATHGKVRFINDSKATNADAAAKALACYDRIYWIVGGVAKAGGIAPLTEFFPRIRHAFLIGESTEAFAATLGDRVALTRCGTLDVAVPAAAALAAADSGPDPVVLLSPACASFDLFRNFEIRGEAFKAAVAALGGRP